MKKIFRYKFLLAAAAFGALYSCSDDDDATASTRLVKPVVTVALSSTSVSEGEAITVTLTADKPINDDMEFKLDLLSSSTGSFRDFTSSGEESTITTGAGTIGYIVRIPAYTTSYTFTITPQMDMLPEGAETLDFRFYGELNSKGIVASSSEFFTVQVANGVSNDFTAVLDWSRNSFDAFGSPVEGEYLDDDGDPHLYCDFDFDLEIYDAGFNLIDDNGDGGTDDADATIDWNGCPATATIPADLPDGDYYIVPSFYTNATGAAPAGGDMTFQITLNMGKPGVFAHTEDLTGAWTYAVGGYEEGNPDAYLPIAIVTKVGTTYTLADANDPTIIWGTGRMADIKKAFKQKAAKLKL